MRHDIGPKLSRATVYRRIAKARAQALVVQDIAYLKSLPPKPLGRRELDSRQDALRAFAAVLLTVLCDKGCMRWGDWHHVKPSRDVLKALKALSIYNPSLLVVVAVDMAKLAIPAKGSQRKISADERKRYTAMLRDRGFSGKNLAAALAACEACNFDAPWIRALEGHLSDEDYRAGVESRSTTSNHASASQVYVPAFGLISNRMVCHWRAHADAAKVRAAFADIMADHGQLPPALPLPDDVKTNENMTNQSYDLYASRRRAAWLSGKRDAFRKAFSRSGHTGEELEKMMKEAERQGFTENCLWQLSAPDLLKPS